MFQKRLLVPALFAAVILLAACGQIQNTLEPLPPPAFTPAPTQMPEPTTAPTAEAGGLAALVESLRAGGAAVEVGGDIAQPFFSVPGQVIRLNGADVQVFEYDDQAARAADSSQIAPTGSPIGTTMVTWVAQPHFWASGRLIVLYLGADAEVQAALSGALGTPVAEGVAGAGLPPAPQLSFEAATYRDEAAGFELQYPAAWTLPAREEQHERGEIVQATESGDPRLDIVILRWDPTHDLDAFIETRQIAWEASGMTIVSEEGLLLAGDVPAAQFVVESSTGEQAYFFFTQVGERYLQLSGAGDLALLKEIGSTVRLLTPEG